MALWAVVPAAGSGARFGAEHPKQYQRLGDRTVLWHAVQRVACAPGLAGVAVGVAADSPYQDALSGLSAAIYPYEGGAQRVATVLRGLAVLPGAAEGDWVLVHDAARPCLARTDLDRLLAAGGPDGALLAAPVADTLKRGCDDRCLETIARAGLWRAFTPQLFMLGTLRTALEQAIAAGADVTDESSAVERLGLRPWLVAGRNDNIKITYPEDLELAAVVLRRLEREGV
ncbi:MAG: 2-C-methyl-D-erythritol 4-phosphate cytidylyltransferase [Acidiferrobacteraceae bacterium]